MLMMSRSGVSGGILCNARLKVRMPMARGRKGPPARGGEILTGRRVKPPPFEFVLDAVAPLSPDTRAMFGCLAVYVGEQIVLILRDRPTRPEDNGVWLATSPEHHASLRRELPMLRSIELFGTQETSWQVLPADAPDFEAAARHACALVLARDVRIGKVPKRRKPRRRELP
jgi:hypothetical protein